MVQIRIIRNSLFGLELGLVLDLVLGSVMVRFSPKEYDLSRERCSCIEITT